MIKTIKVKKQMRLDELIKYIFDNDIRDKSFTSHIEHEPHYKYRNKVYVHTNGTISLGHPGTSILSKEDTYTVEVEEDITEDTEFKSAVVVDHGGELELYENLSIKGFKYRWPNSLQMHAVIDGKLQLIWEADSDEL